MRTDPPDPLTHLPAWLRGRSARARDWLAGLNPAARWALGAAVAAVVAAGFYLGTASDDADTSDWLYRGHRFSPSEIPKVVKVLEAEDFAPTVGGGRIGVAHRKVAAAESVLEKRGLGLRRFPDLPDEPEAPGLLEPFGAAQQRRTRETERAIQAAIHELDDALDARVSLSRTASRGLRPADEVRVSIILVAEGGVPVPNATVEAISNLVDNLVPDLKPDGLSVVDTKGWVYRSPHNPELRRVSQTRAREERLRGKIFEALGHIRNIRVSVTIDAPAPAALAPAPPAPPPAITVNQPLDDEPAPPPSPPSAGPRPETAKAKVLVQVPDSYVLQRFRDISGSSRRPTATDLDPLFEQARENILKTVRAIAPASELGDIEVRRFDPDPDLPAAPPADAGAHRLRTAWLQAAAIGGAVLAALLAALGGHWWSSRQVAARAPSPAHRLARDRADARGAAERVRELVRLDPGAAAGVLHRWVGQSGGHGS